MEIRLLENESCHDRIILKKMYPVKGNYKGEECLPDETEFVKYGEGKR